MWRVSVGERSACREYSVRGVCGWLQGLITACATILPLLACSLDGTCRGVLKTRFSISIVGSQRVVKPHLPGCGGRGKGGSSVDVQSLHGLARGGGLTHALLGQSLDCTSELCRHGGCAFCASHAGDGISSTSTALQVCEASGLERLPPEA